MSDSHPLGDIPVCTPLRSWMLDDGTTIREGSRVRHTPPGERGTVESFAGPGWALVGEAAACGSSPHSNNGPSSHHAVAGRFCAFRHVTTARRHPTRAVNLRGVSARLASTAVLTVCA